MRGSRVRVTQAAPFHFHGKPEFVLRRASALRIATSGASWQRASVPGSPRTGYSGNPMMFTSADVVHLATQSAFGRPLVTNVHRSMLVEAMVALALQPHWQWCSADYASCDFIDREGVRLEVKQSAALQSWNAQSGRISSSQFDIAMRTGEWVRDVWHARLRRNADIYVFAHHPVSDRTADHRDPEQWNFYVVAERKLSSAKSIRLPRVQALAPACRLTDLAVQVAAVSRAFSQESESGAAAGLSDR